MTKVLIVEDNQFNVEVLSRFLKRQNYEILLARDGREGLSTAFAQRPDLILMDLGLPDLDGWEAIRRLKAHPTTEKIPIVVLTAHAGEQDISRALQAGCDHYETKPINFNRLMKKIDSFLDPLAGTAI